MHALRAAVAKALDDHFSQVAHAEHDAPEAGAFNRPSWCAKNGFPAMTSSFGTFSVRGRSRVARPPARMATGIWRARAFDQGRGTFKSVQILRAVTPGIPETRNCGNFFLTAVDVDGVVAALAEELASMSFQMSYEINPLHAGVYASDSRMTSCPRKSSSANSRLASKTMATASARLGCAYSRVAP